MCFEEKHLFHNVIPYVHPPYITTQTYSAEGVTEFKFRAGQLLHNSSSQIELFNPPHKFPV